MTSKTFDKFLDQQIKVLKSKASETEDVMGLLVGDPQTTDGGKKIKGTLAYAGVSLNNRLYLPEELKKGDGMTVPLILNHASTSGAEEELDRLPQEFRSGLESGKEMRVGEVSLQWDPDNLTLFYEGNIEDKFFQREVDDANMAVSLGMYYDSDSPQVCDEACYTVIKGAEFHEVSLVYHPGFPIATIEAYEALQRKQRLGESVQKVKFGREADWSHSYDCSQCERSFFSQKDLDSHAKKSGHVQEIPPTKEEEAEQRREEWYQEYKKKRADLPDRSYFSQLGLEPEGKQGIKSEAHTIGLQDYTYYIPDKERENVYQCSRCGSTIRNHSKEETGLGKDMLELHSLWHERDMANSGSHKERYEKMDKAWDKPIVEEVELTGDYCNMEGVRKKITVDDSLLEQFLEKRWKEGEDRLHILESNTSQYLSDYNHGGLFPCPTSNYFVHNNKSLIQFIKNWASKTGKVFEQERLDPKNWKKWNPEASEAKRKAGYAKCPYCNTQMSRLDWLQDHIRDQHPRKATSEYLDGGRVWCDICGEPKSIHPAGHDFVSSQDVHDPRVKESKAKAVEMPELVISRRQGENILSLLEEELAELRAEEPKDYKAIGKIRLLIMKTRKEIYPDQDPYLTIDLDYKKLEDQEANTGLPHSTTFLDRQHQMFDNTANNWSRAGGSGDRRAGQVGHVWQMFKNKFRGGHQDADYETFSAWIDYAQNDGISYEEAEEWWKKEVGFIPNQRFLNIDPSGRDETRRTRGSSLLGESSWKHCKKCNQMRKFNTSYDHSTGTKVIDHKPDEQGGLYRINDGDPQPRYLQYCETCDTPDEDEVTRTSPILATEVIYCKYCDKVFPNNDWQKKAQHELDVHGGKQIKLFERK